MTTKQWAIILVPTVIAGGFIVYYLRKYSIPTKTAIPVIGGNGPAGKVQSASPAVPASPSLYPLQSGSNNTAVGQLQDALGITIDNDFGSQTAAALMEQAGLTSITSAAQLSQVIDSILSNDEGNATTNAQLSNTILSNYQGSNNIALVIGVSSYTYLQAVNTTTFKQVGPNSDGTWFSVGFQLALSNGKNLPLSTYQPFAIDPDTGNLIINCVSGSNQGYWSANPNDLSLS